VTREPARSERKLTSTSEQHRGCVRLDVVASTDEWAEVVAQIRQEGGPLKNRAVMQLYRYAMEEGPRILSSYRREFGDAVIEELTHALIAERLHDIVTKSDNPKAYFRTALVRRAISWARRGDAAVVEQPSDTAPAWSSGATGPANEETDRQQFVHDAQVILDSLSPRDQQILVAVGLGEDRDELARMFQTSRANIDQIVSRARKLLRGGSS
jgi:RNA polymerase sigma factor (sigma-70 family)